MIKKILFLSLIFCSPVFLHAQEFEKKSSISISVGPSIPVGTFALKDIADDKAGLASVGGFATIAYQYQFSRFFGLVGALNGRIHGVDKNALQLYTVPTGSGSSLSLTTTTWNFFSIMAGISQLIPITKDEKLTLEVKEQVGIQFSNSPEIQIAGFIPGVGTINSIEQSQSKKSFAYGLSFGFNYKIGEKLGLKFHSEYQGASPRFAYANGDVVSTYGLRQNTSAINVGLGLSLGF